LQNATTANDRGAPSPVALSIAAVERDTGLSKDTLRVWERRYGFPAPWRDAFGERAYPLEQVDRLRLIKRLLDVGHRPGRVVMLTVDELQRLSEAIPEAPQRAGATRLDSDELRANLDLIRSHDVPALRRHLVRLLSRFGVARFVTEVVAPLNAAVGDAWLRGQLEIHEEHVYTEAVQIVLRQAIAAVPEPPAGAAPRVLLGTFPGEPHGLGLLMAEAVLALDGCACVSLGVQTPIWEIVRAAQAHRTDIVALGFTGCMNPNQIADGLHELRIKLPAGVAVWAGGSAPVLYRRRIDGVTPIPTLDTIAGELMRWRQVAAG
jgi:DNA-binding transcriptional MerR regulator/methylmalonyl-CoA mutase cobalamin-binding subunit